MLGLYISLSLALVHTIRYELLISSDCLSNRFIFSDIWPMLKVLYCIHFLHHRLSKDNAPGAPVSVFKVQESSVYVS